MGSSAFILKSVFQNFGFGTRPAEPIEMKQSFVRRFFGTLGSRVASACATPLLLITREFFQRNGYDFLMLATT